MTNLSINFYCIFIDESGDFGEYDHHSPYYIITMVFHDQQEDVWPAISKLNQELSYMNLDNLCIYTGPIIRKYYEDFLHFDDMKIYYDNVQVEVSKILSSVFNALLPNPIFRKVMSSEYKLFQAADLLCTLELVKLKLENNIFSKSEKIFFGNIRDLKKNYLKPLDKKEWS